MKTIGIITYHHYYNYGTVLQAYALQKAIEQGLNCESEIIDYRFSEEKKISLFQLIILRLRRIFIYIFEIKRVWRLITQQKILLKKQHSFDLFFHDNLKVSDKTYHNKKEILESPPKYDIYMTGSDQTWSPQIGLSPVMFLNFVNNGAKKTAYAPSVGVSSFSKETNGVITRYLKDYSFISCRETVGATLLQKCTDKKVSIVLDPTLLISKTEWNQIAVAPAVTKPYILCYFIGHISYYRTYAQQLAKLTGFTLIYIPVSWVDLVKGNIFAADAGPKEFLGLIRDAQIVLTDSYHGTIFSINFQKDFYTFLKTKGGVTVLDNSRISDILSRLNLENRLKNEHSEVEYTHIDYSRTNVLLEKEREHSWSYLRNAIQ